MTHQELAFEPEDDGRVYVHAEDAEGFEDEYAAEVVGLRFVPEDAEGTYASEWVWEYVLVYDLDGSIMSDIDRRWRGLAEQAARVAIVRESP